MMAFRDHLLKSWQHATVLTVFLWPLSVLYRAVFFIRKQCYQLGVFSSYKAPVPVIIIGNLTVGGTGKTPLVIHLVSVLRELGYTPGVISRGYHGDAASYPLFVTATTPVSESGDEPALIVRRTDVPMAVGPNRRANIEQLLSQSNVDIIISDDGLQHLALERDVEICLIDETTNAANHSLLPAGPYREPLSRLKSVDIIVRHRQSDPLKVNAATGKNFTMILNASEPQSINNQSDSSNLIFDKKVPIHAVAGIGNPQRFFSTCEQLGLEFQAHSFADHHQFKVQDFDFGDQRSVLMTEKDAVKCTHFENDKLWFLPVDAQLSSGFTNILADLIKAKK